MSFVYELLRAGSTIEDSDSGAEVARKFNDNFKRIQEKFSSLDDTVIRGVKINGVLQAIKNCEVDIPVGTDTQVGVVRSSAGENRILIRNDGAMEVDSLNVEKLTQNKNDYVILDGNFE